MPPNAEVGLKFDSLLKVKAEKVSRLLDLVGELSLVGAEVTHHPDLAGLELEGYAVSAHNLEVLIRELQDLASGLRLVPIDGVFKRMQRLVRDLARQTDKAVDLVLEGEETEIDKVLIDQLHDPLMHIIRNAVDHGLEPAEERLAASKSAQGQIVLSAHQQGQEIKITIADDGRGLDRDKILTKARSQGLVGSHENPDDAIVWSYIFHSGLSTAQEISNLSGRGVGMDVVQTTIQALRGRISVKSQPGQGTRLTLHIPLTLAFLDSMIIRLQKHLYAIPINVVAEVLKPEAEQVIYTSTNQSELLRIREELIPICRLPKFFQQADTTLPLQEQIVVIVSTTNGPLGLAIDEVVGQQQVTMKSLEGQLKDIRAGVGCVLLGTGEVAIALDCEQLSQELMTQEYG
ncbi:MAG: chemotaxis protein CheA [Anaerolineae bacterium]|nr:chemotaxis protein CheA [Anaerolineae bacterium]